MNIRKGWLCVNNSFLEGTGQQMQLRCNCLMFCQLIELLRFLGVNSHPLPATASVGAVTFFTTGWAQVFENTFCTGAGSCIVEVEANSTVWLPFGSLFWIFWYLATKRLNLLPDGRWVNRWRWNSNIKRPQLAINHRPWLFGMGLLSKTELCIVIPPAPSTKTGSGSSY